MNQKNHIIGWIFVFLTLIFTLILLMRTLTWNPQALITPITENLTSLDIPFIGQKKAADQTLEQTVQTILKETDGTYGIFIKNLTTNETYTFNEHRMFQSGSLYKLWVMATVYEQVKAGALRETSVLEQEIPILNEKFNIATEDAERTEGRISLSATDALSQMITISDNYAALLLSLQVRLSNVAEFLDTHGFSESKVGTDGSIPTTTATDIASFFEHLYTGTLIDPEYDKKMLDLLKQQQLNNKIPKNLPKTITIAHKTGEFNSYTHDGGIVYTPHGDYIIVILSDSPKPLKSEHYITDLSEAVYRYFTK